MKKTTEDMMILLHKQNGECHGISCGECPLSNKDIFGGDCTNNPNCQRYAKEWLGENCTNEELLELLL